MVDSTKTLFQHSLATFSSASVSCDSILIRLCGLSPCGGQAAAHDQLRGLPEPRGNRVSLPLVGRRPPLHARPGCPGGSSLSPTRPLCSRKGAFNFKQAHFIVQQLQVSQPACISSCLLGSAQARDRDNTLARLHHSMEHVLLYDAFWEVGPMVHAHIAHRHVYQ